MRLTFLALLGLAPALISACTLDRHVLAPSDGSAGFDTIGQDAGCTPEAETCNERDDDCDGSVDEDFDLQTELANCGQCRNACLGSDHGVPVCNAGTCGLTCDDAFLDCNGIAADGCEATRSDSHTCGTCGNDCTTTASPLCMEDAAGAFTCVASCTLPAELCGASCVDTTTSVANCGGCGMPCASRPGTSVTCVASTCTYACDTGFGSCDGDGTNGCETPTTTATDCGMCATPCAIPGAVASCATGVCAFVMCGSGLADCDASPDCERSITTTTDCGACGVPCARAHAAASCAGGTCALGTCNPGFDNSDGMPDNGCEADLNASTTCGSCMRACTGTDRCMAGTCVNPRAIVEVGAGIGFSCARIADGRVYCWGDNSSGQLGIGTVVESHIPVQVPGITDAVDLAVGDLHVCIIHTGGAVTCWGENNKHEVGDNATTTDHQSPFDVPGISDARSIAAGDEHTCAVRAGGEVSCWGRNDRGQLGSATGDRGTPMDVTGLGPAAQVDCGIKFTCAVLRSGAVMCFGENGAHQLGDGGMTDHSTPVAAGSFTDAVQVACGSDFACVVHATGVVDCWGADDHGQLGDGLVAASRASIAPLSSAPPAIAEVSCGTNHCCARTRTNIPYCWGANAAGQLGDMSFMERLVPTTVFGGYVFLAVAAGDEHSCAASATGVYCWGADVTGELGIGSTSSSNVPVMTMVLPPP
jgi:alpha-tubulin suppressor-like RCC1 family protein